MFVVCNFHKLRSRGLTLNKMLRWSYVLGIFRLCGAVTNEYFHYHGSIIMDKQIVCKNFCLNFEINPMKKDGYYNIQHLEVYVTMTVVTLI